MVAEFGIPDGSIRTGSPNSVSVMLWGEGQSNRVITISQRCLFALRTVLLKAVLSGALAGVASLSEKLPPGLEPLLER